jgi:hypothetical protein
VMLLMMKMKHAMEISKQCVIFISVRRHNYVRLNTDYTSAILRIVTLAVLCVFGSFHLLRQVAGY